MFTSGAYAHWSPRCDHYGGPFQEGQYLTYFWFHEDDAFGHFNHYFHNLWNGISWYTAHTQSPNCGGHPGHVP
jgi:hypothetical protein